MSLQIEYIYFDIDGTLCDYGVHPRTVLRRVCAGFEIDATLDHHEYYDLYKVLAQERPDSSYEEISKDAYRGLLEKEGYGDATLAGRVAEAYRRIRLSSLRLYPETVAVLDSLSQRYRLGIISNGPSEIQREKMVKFRLVDYFDTVIISSEVGVEKPSATIFSHALQQAGAEAARSAHVGDSLSHDVKGALEAGFTSFWINRGVLDFDGVEVAPQYELQSLEELLPILDG